MTVSIVVLGAGVSGLTTALSLARTRKDASITVVARHMPGDYNINYASPWAGANFQPLSNEVDCRWEERSWPEMSRLAAEVPEAGIHFQRSRIYRRKEELERGGGASFDALFSPNPWYRRLFPDFRELEPKELPAGVQSGCEYTGLCINTAVYLPWLVGQCRRLGVVFRRAQVSDVSELMHYHKDKRAGVDIVVNASGLGSLTLGGVTDKKMSPIRGQIVLVENEAEPMFNVSGTEDGPEEVAYLMTRAAGGGTVLGGTYQRGSWDPNPDPEIEKRIIRRCMTLSPSLVAGGKEVKVIRSGVGLRPFREGGVRVEADLDTLSGPDGDRMMQNQKKKKTLLVHNYGHAGWGYQGSYGCAERVVQLVDEFLEQERAGRIASRL